LCERSVEESSFRGCLEETTDRCYTKGQRKFLGDVTFVTVALSSCCEGRSEELNCRDRPEDVPDCGILKESSSRLERGKER